MLQPYATMTNFNETFPVFTSEYDAIYTGYKIELIGLAALLSAKNKSEYLSRISNYNDFKKRVTDKRYQKNISKLFKKGSIIHISQQTEILTDVLLTAQLAICCELFEGVKIPLHGLKPEAIETTLQTLLGKYKNTKKGDTTLQNLDIKLHSIDAFRTVQILKALGLYTMEAQDICQLSLGVGSASKDLKSIHLQPELKILPDNILAFNVKKLHAKDVILVDGDPQREALFHTLNNNKDYPIVAINDDAYDTLLKIPDILIEKKLAPRNAVVALRIDHRMIPDVTKFFRLLENSIDNISHLIVTIGSGFNKDDFTGRTTVLQNMYNFLKSAGLRPVLIKLHSQGTLEEQWNDHAFGLKNMTTYQILYCKLKKNILKKQFNK